MLTKTQAGFKSPASGKDHCVACLHWRAPNRCEIVGGKIKPGDWCELFSAREASVPAVSRAQQQAMAIAEHEPAKLYAKNKGLLKMSSSQLHDFAATKRKGLLAYAPSGKKKFKI